MSNSIHFNGRKRTLKAILILLVAFSIVIGGGAFALYSYMEKSLEPVDPHNHQPRIITIKPGSSVTQIAEQLKKNDLIKSPTLFKYYVKYKNHTGLQAGTYEFTPAMEIEDIIKGLKSGNTLENAAITLVIPEGSQLKEIVAIIGENSDHKEEIVWKKLNDRSYIEKLIQKYPDLLTKDLLNQNIKYPLEGYLYPATYAFHDPKIKLEVIIERMIKKTEKVLSQYKGAMAAKNLSTHQLLTMASLIEEEATEKADRKKISSVFYNRLDKNMPLQTDPTVLYALGSHKKRVIYDDLKVKSPYNTYNVKGLPPGPIANSGVSSIEAAINPEQTDFLYFLASPAGDVYYSKTLKEHNQFKEKYITNYYEGKKQ
ncbi:UPF0755 protein [Oikeobacillus pervagus]|uniref:Endolytic murein transglycosylase n=1 Tax=Oikeobacillus pervagus TaxID=1325931 RepID=A0AAJ1WG42_9BACI|nr:endolytic transglycosylase MltG [Oikeobacillus pervagus]MDQ0214622.1 UPF0755 protein [Oikeobacillus pervagus]